ncbi:putative plasma membrane low affinity zinc ion transporter [Myriangium duriaei CBS 260.36]|uniref:Plasma membrane low affinity zinc ion transporter n=1 Tax=Myriangium duriaei CBS 260.36 TaxID=1168546 RepID=A0A9P4IVP8_9PEZI|nr:putative plasma membrane low affinity zinc ion transporter [Myriangium duriaei CBS 260.36]
MAASAVQELAWLVVRQATDAGNNTTPTPNGVAANSTSGDDESCVSGNEYDGRLGVRISAIFVILIGSFLGAWFPTFASRRRGIGVPDAAFFIAKYFGSGVIIATAFIHLLAPANENLSNECLPAIYQAYPWVEAIALMTIFVLFFVELMTMRYAKFGHSHDLDKSVLPQFSDDESKAPDAGTEETPANALTGGDHLGHSRSHVDNEQALDAERHGAFINTESYSAQLTSIFILEFGVIFHSIFIGLTLAVSGSEFVSLYIVLVFHQTFEGLGLGSRLAGIPWPKSKRWTPYFLAIGYAISTPLAIAIGLGVRKTYPPNSTTTLIVNGVFDSISAGILIYTGLVELMAHEFMFSPYMSKAPIKNVLSAFFLMCLGAGLMALLGKWA